MARTFNGSSQAASTSSSLNLSSYTTMSLSFWVYKSSFADDDQLSFESSSNFNSNANGLIVDLNSSYGSVCGFSIHLGSAVYNTVTVPRPSTGWRHYLWVIDRNGGATQTVAVYIDGVAQTLTQVNSGITSGNFGNYTWYLAARNNASLWCNSRMAEIAMFAGVTLTANDAAALARGVSADRLRSAKPLHYWPMWGHDSPEIDLGTTRTSLTLTASPAKSVSHPPVVPFSRRWWTPAPEPAAAAAPTDQPFRPFPQGVVSSLWTIDLSGVPQRKSTYPWIAAVPEDTPVPKDIHRQERIVSLWRDSASAQQDKPTYPWVEETPIPKDLHRQERIVSIWAATTGPFSANSALEWLSAYFAAEKSSSGVYGPIFIGDDPPLQRSPDRLQQEIANLWGVDSAGLVYSRETFPHADVDDGDADDHIPNLRGLSMQQRIANLWGVDLTGLVYSNATFPHAEVDDGDADDPPTNMRWLSLQQRIAQSWHDAMAVEQWPVQRQPQAEEDNPPDADSVTETRRHTQMMGVLAWYEAATLDSFPAPGRTPPSPVFPTTLVPLGGASGFMF